MTHETTRPDTAQAPETHRPSVLGLERLGLLALRYPRTSGLLVVAATLLGLVQIFASLAFDGSFNRMLEGKNPAYVEFIAFERAFHTFSNDEVILVRAPSLKTAAGFERLRDLQIELNFAEEVGGILSVFSLSRATADGKTLEPLLPESFADDATLRSTIAELAIRQPAVRSLYDPDAGAAVMVVIPKPGNDASAGLDPDAVQKIKDLIAREGGADLDVSFVGRPAIQRALISGLQRDQITLTAFATLMCAIISYVMFRTLTAALLCTLPPLIALAWYLGLQAAFGVKIDFLTTIIPVLLMVLTFADGLHLYFDWRRRCDAGDEPLQAIATAVSAVGPACVLAHVTTGVAFLALVATSNVALIGMALAGILAITIGFIVVMVALPVAAHFAVTLQAPIGPLALPVLQGLARPGLYALRRFSRAIVLGSTAATLPLLAVHLFAPAQYSLIDYVPFDAKVRDGIHSVDRIFGGSSQIFIALDRDTAGNTLSTAEIDRLRQIETAIDGIVGQSRTMSIAAARNSAATDTTPPPDTLTLPPPGAHPLLQWVISRDRTRLLMSTFISQKLSAADTSRLVARLERAIAAAAPGARVSLTGPAVVHAAVVPDLITDLRHGLVGSILVSVIIMGLAFRSWRLGLACLVPNILPILLAEIGILVAWGGIDMTSAVALTIGFGLAVDDSIHLLNRYVAEPERERHPVQAMRRALQAVSPALVATTLVLSCGMLATFFSTLPTVGLFGGVMIGILVAALACDIFILPATALFIERWRRG